jgi:molybdenum cofactor biosynthesis protein B
VVRIQFEHASQVLPAPVLPTVGSTPLGQLPLTLHRVRVLGDGAGIRFFASILQDRPLHLRRVQRQSASFRGVDYVALWHPLPSIDPGSVDSPAIAEQENIRMTTSAIRDSHNADDGGEDQNGQTSRIQRYPPFLCPVYGYNSGPSNQKEAGMSETVAQHKSQAPDSVRCAVITVSDSRTLETDTGGAAVVARLVEAGHEVVQRHIVPDDPVRTGLLLRDLGQNDGVEAILMTGGTGISARDQTFETVSGLLTKPLPGYGELFRMLSYQEIGAAAMLSRAVGGLMGRTVLLTMPGSRAAVQLAMERVILPELGHLVREAGR